MTDRGRRLTDLANRCRAGETEALTELMRQAEYFIRYMVQPHREALRGCRSRIDHEDLMSAGRIGVLQALERFDGRGAFTTYAGYWIRKEVHEAFVGGASPVAITRSVHDRYQAHRQGRRVACPLLPDRLEAAEVALRGARWIDAIPDVSARSDEEEAREMDEDEARRRVEAILSGLPDREAAILRLRHGLDGERPMSLREIGESLGITKERVRQIIQAAIDRVRSQHEEIVA